MIVKVGIQDLKLVFVIITYLAFLEESKNQNVKIINTIWKVDGVKKIFNEIEIGDGLSISERTEDLILQSKIKTKLLFKSGILSNNYSIDVVNKKVYVMGTSKTIEEKSLIEISFFHE